MTSPEQHRQVKVRHTPKLVPFLVAGVLAALAAAFVVVLVTEPDENYTFAGSVGYMTFAFSFPCVAVAAILWLTLERRSRAHGREYTARRLPAQEGKPTEANSAPQVTAAEEVPAEETSAEGSPSEASAAENAPSRHATAEDPHATAEDTASSSTPTTERNTDHGAR